MFRNSKSIPCKNAKVSSQKFARKNNDASVLFGSSWVNTGS
jgi:hypothetical protein